MDPRELGALCDRCPLKGSIVVPPERTKRSSPFAIVIGEAPGEDEEREGVPFFGKSGQELRRGFQAVGIRRSDCHITNAMLCRPPGNKWEKSEREASRRNKLLPPDAPEEAKYLSPIDACRPRLLNEIRSLGPPANIIALGNVPLRSLTGQRGSIMNLRGGPMEMLIGRVLPTLHPAFVMRSRRWTGAWIADLARAQRWFTTGLKWTDPFTIYRPTPKTLSSWIESEAGSPFVIYDVETAPGFPEVDRYDPMYDRLRCIGLSSHDGKRAIVVRFRSKEDPSRMFYSMDDYRRLIDIFREFFTSSRWTKGGHNAGYYDRQVSESHFCVTPTPLIDTIGLHKFVEPELPHGLDYVGSVHTDVWKWKQGHRTNENETDEEEEKYCVTDCAVTALSVRPLVEAIKARKQEEPARWFPFLQSLCVDLHKVGMYVDQKKRMEWDTKMLREAQKFLNIIRDATGNAKFNPGSVPQVRSLLFEEWELMPVGYTEMGDPTTGDDALREILAKQPLTDAQRAVLTNVRLYRRRTKYRGTYTQKFRPMGVDITGDFFTFDEEESIEDRDRRYKKEMKKPGIVLADGRVHGDWNPHGTLGWRLSSSNPNLQNVPNKLRDMFAEEEGWCLVACDQAQLELRLGAALAKSKVYIDAFRDRRDPHREFCIDIFGEEFKKASKDGQKAFRRTVKELTYASEYRAEVETVHSVLTSAEDDDTEELLYPNMTIPQVGMMRRKWLERAKFDRWWEEEDATFAKNGYLLDPILGLRCDFLDGVEDPQIGNKLVNFRCQSGGAAIVHKATKRFIENSPKDWAGRVQLVQQGHDALVARVKADHSGPQIIKRDEKGKIVETKWCASDNCGCLPSRVGKFMEECFTFPIGSFPGIDVEFLGEMKIGNNWKEV